MDHHIKFFKHCLSQFLLYSFLNTLSQIFLTSMFTASLWFYPEPFFNLNTIAFQFLYSYIYILIVQKVFNHFHTNVIGYFCVTLHCSNCCQRLERFEINSSAATKWVNPFHTNALFLYLWKRQKTFGFLPFSRGIERDIGMKRVNSF